MDGLDFLEQQATADSTASLMVLLPDGAVIPIQNVSPSAVLDKCPLLFHAFEFRQDGDVRQASIEATSRSAVVSLLRFLYTGTYLTRPEESSDSFLLHVEAFKVAEDFDIPEFQVQAYVNFVRETEFACCTVTPPSDLCATIKFLYRYLASQQSQQQQSLLDTILHYCVSVFKYQRLGEREDFRQVVFENSAFHQGLCRINMHRDFEDDGAIDIMQLPVRHPAPYSQAALLKRTLGDLQFELWQDTDEPLPEDNEPKDCPSPSKRQRAYRGSFTLVHRPKSSGGVVSLSEGESESEISSDEHDFTLVHRPKVEQNDESVSDSEIASVSSDTSAQLPDSSPFIEPKSESQDERASDDDEWALI